MYLTIKIKYLPLKGMVNNFQKLLWKRNEVKRVTLFQNEKELLKKKKKTIICKKLNKRYHRSGSLPS